MTSLLASVHDTDSGRVIAWLLVIVLIPLGVGLVYGGERLRLTLAGPFLRSDFILTADS